VAEPIGSRPGPAHAARTTQAGAWRLKPGGLLLRAVLQGRFTKAQNRKFFHAMTAQKSYYVSATAIIIENCNNGLRNRKLDFTRYAHVLLSLTLRKRPCMQFSKCSASWVSFPPRPVLVAQNSDPWYARQELGYFEVVGVVFRTVVVAFG